MHQALVRHVQSARNREKDTYRYIMDRAKEGARMSYCKAFSRIKSLHLKEIKTKFATKIKSVLCFIDHVI